MESLRQNWLQLATVQIGGVICLPIFVVGYIVAKSFGVFSAILAIILGNFLLFLMAISVAKSSVKHRKSTAEYAVFLFGPKGKHFFSLSIVFTMLVWFGIQINIIVLSVRDVIEVNFLGLENVFLGLVLTITGMGGMRFLTTLANMSMPLLLLTIGYAVYQAGSSPMILRDSEILTYSGLSIILGSSIGVVVDLPTFFCISRSTKDSVFAACILFILVIPLLEGVGVYLFAHGQGESIVELLLSGSSDKLWKTWIIAFLVFAGWTTNNANLYSAAINLRTLLPTLSSKTHILIAGFFGSALSYFNLLENMTLFLDCIGILLGSMGAVMFIQLLKEKKEYYYVNFSSWLIGVFGGIFSLFGYAFTEIPMLDAFIVATMGIVASSSLSLLVHKRKRNIDEKSFVYRS